jgi:putative flippase GtrA
MTRLASSVVRFVGVGSIAAAVHMCCVWFLVETFHWNPLAANGAAFLVAFGVSYAGHAHLTFAGARFQHRRALGRFFILAVAGFLLNEGLYSLLLYQLGWPYLPALATALLAVASATFVGARLWAFARVH